MATYTIICMSMGIWPTEKNLYTWIRNNWKPKGEINLHLGSKGFFIVVLTNLEDKDKVFEGGPYFYAAVGLYMRPWVRNEKRSHRSLLRRKIPSPDRGDPY